MRVLVVISRTRLAPRRWRTEPSPITATARPSPAERSYAPLMMTVIVLGLIALVASWYASGGG